MENEKETLTILIVDDSEMELEILEAILEQLGYKNVIKCSSGFDAVRFAEEYRPDLILTDIMMPGIDGGALKELLTKNPETKDIPTIFLSAIITKKEQKSLEQSKTSNIIIAKPYSADEILKAIGFALGQPSKN